MKIISLYRLIVIYITEITWEFSLSADSETSLNAVPAAKKKPKKPQQNRLINMNALLTEFWCSFCFIPKMLFKLLLLAESVELYISLPCQETSQ